MIDHFIKERLSYDKPEGERERDYRPSLKLVSLKSFREAKVDPVF